MDCVSVQNWIYIYEFVWQWGSCREPLFKDAAGFHSIKVLFTNYLEFKNVEDKPVSCKDFLAE